MAAPGGDKKSVSGNRAAFGAVYVVGYDMVFTLADNAAITKQCNGKRVRDR